MAALSPQVVSVLLYIVDVMLPRGSHQGVGPRYCPSIEKKIIRFPDKESHQVWLEPEGLDSHVIYPSGINTALPPDVQLEMLRSMKGLENVDMVRVARRCAAPFRCLNDARVSAAASGLRC